jgi:glycosyltransferase involved in cell wall biosynthesis
MSMEFMMAEGLKRGHTIHTFTNQTMRDLTGYDFVIPKNVTTFGDRVLNLKEPVINWPSDYTFCRWRLFYKQGSGCRECKGVRQYASLFNNAVLNIFLSPLHKSAYEHVYPKMSESICLPSPIEVERFKPLNIPRQPNLVVGVNSLLPFKGINTVLDFAAQNHDKKFIFYGGKPDQPFRMPPNASYAGLQPNERLPEIYSAAEYFIHLPETPQPFERTVAEAYLCGCKLLINPLVGAVTYDWWTDRDSVRKHVGEAAGQIWNELEARL